MAGFVGFVLFRIFHDFRKVFEAVLPLADGLLCFLSGGGSSGDLLFQFCDGTYFIVCLCSNLPAFIISGSTRQCKRSGAVAYSVLMPCICLSVHLHLA